MAVDAEVNQLMVPLGDGLNNILNAYQDLDVVEEEEVNGMVDDMGVDEIIPNNLNIQPPEVAHLMLGRIETFFFPVPEEHNLHSRFSKQGLELWEKYFAPNLLPKESLGGSKVHHIPVSWFNYITLMLMSPEKFDWAKDFLSSQLWEIIQEPVFSEPTIAFCIPDKCAVSQAPSCLLHDSIAEFSSPENNVMKVISPKRKRREGKVPLVETEVRRSPRLVLLNDGFKNHTSCSSKNCLICNANPPLINSKVVKNLASSFCKVDDMDVDRKLMKRTKVVVGDIKAPGSATSMQDGSIPKPSGKKGKGMTTNAVAAAKEKKDGAAGGAAQGPKKRPNK
jgi:hypothetical protein